MITESFWIIKCNSVLLFTAKWTLEKGKWTELEEPLFILWHNRQEIILTSKKKCSCIMSKNAYAILCHIQELFWKKNIWQLFLSKNNFMSDVLYRPWCDVLFRPAFCAMQCMRPCDLWPASCVYNLKSKPI